MTRTRQLANCLDGVTVHDMRGQQFDAIKAYWADPAPFDAETARNRAIAHAAIDAAVRKSHPHIGGDDDAA